MKNIKKEYDEKWSLILNSIDKFNDDDFINFHKVICTSGMNQLSKKFLNNDWFIYGTKIKNISFEKIFFYKHLYLINKLIEKITSFEEIIELGSGWGRTILYINQILDKKFFSGEINEYGIKTQKKLIEKFNLKNLECFYFDYYNFTKLKFPSKLKNPVVITSNSVEQIEFMPKNFYIDLKKYLGVTDLQVCHLEPIGFQFEPFDKLDLQHHEYNKNNKYNLNINSLIKNLKYKLLEIDKNIVTCESDKKTIFSPMSLITIKY